MSDKTLQRIEETLSHQEQQIHDLSEMVIRQGAEIDTLKKRLLKMQNKIDGLEDAAHAPEGEGLSVAEIAARDKPPHY